jgi:hypothetical protein
MGSSRRALRFVITGAAALAFTVAPTALMASSNSAVQHDARPCYNGISPGNPYVPSCTVPGPKNKIRGSAPDAAAIIACKNYPGCLSWYINNP